MKYAGCTVLPPIAKSIRFTDMRSGVPSYGSTLAVEHVACWLHTPPALVKFHFLGNSELRVRADILYVEYSAIVSVYYTPWSIERNYITASLFKESFKPSIN
jgi:hypothetical protein